MAQRPIKESEIPAVPLPSNLYEIARTPNGLIITYGIGNWVRRRLGGRDLTRNTDD